MRFSAPSRGVWGHGSPEKILNLGLPEWWGNHRIPSDYILLAWKDAVIARHPVLEVEGRSLEELEVEGRSLEDQ